MNKVKHNLFLSLAGKYTNTSFERKSAALLFLSSFLKMEVADSSVTLVHINQTKNVS
jgi:hypothetical protein